MAVDTDATPFQTPPSMKNAAGLSGSNEYAATWTGQSNSRPRGFPADGLAVAQELALARTGLDIVSIVIPDEATRAVGTVEVLAVTSPVLSAFEWHTNAWLRLGVMAHTIAGAPLLGYAKVLSNGSTSLVVQWIRLPVNDQTVAAYLVREASPGFESADGRPGGARYYAYEQVRVLTPYAPLKDIEPPVVGGTVWLAPNHAEYPVENGPLRTGRKLALPAPWVLPAAVTTFDDLGVFLPLTRREGSHGYGISEIADASYAGTGAPRAHPIIRIVTGVIEFHATTVVPLDLAGGYLIVDWEVAGVSKRSWARIASNTNTTFTPDASSWLGDGAPVTPPLKEDVVFDDATDLITWVGHSLVEGDRVSFFGGVPPTGVNFGQPYVVRNVAGDDFQISEVLGRPVVDFSSAGTDVDGVQVWWYTAWIAHWRDNPYMWLPGPEFAYPNEDQQPHGPFVHWRARGQILFVHMVGEEPGGAAVLFPFDGVADGRFGAMLPFAWRMAAALGKRINLVCLGVNGAPLVPSHVQNLTAYPGRLGWWEFDRFGYGLSLEDTQSMLSGRLKRLITVIAPNALLAEVNTKPLKYLSSCHVQGETDALLDAGRELYVATITDFKRWLRDLFDTISANPYEGGAQVPFAQPLLTRDPWESAAAGANPDFQTFGWDTQGDANNAIRLAHTADPFADYTLTEDLPKMKFLSGVIDNAHFSGQGMVWQGSRLAKVILDLVEFGFSHTSAALVPNNAHLLRIANIALLYIGQGARQITSLSSQTAEATLITTLLPEAIRQMLSMRPWSWATRMIPATKVKHQNPRWGFAYAVPGRAIIVLEIVSPPVPSASGVVAAPLPVPIDVEAPKVAGPEPFEIRRDQSGNRILHTDVDETPAADATATSVADGKLHPERLPTPPLIRYVDHVLDPRDFSDSFATALTWLLASMLAPSLVKGVEGARVAKDALEKCTGFVRVEATHETMTEHPRGDARDEHIPSWMKDR